MRGYKVGDKVASRKCWARAEFVGEITLIGFSGKDEPYYHVVDADGIEWHRPPEDLSLLFANDNATSQVEAA